MKTPYTKKEIEEILKSHEFLYHQVNLPYGLHTHGRDRSHTRDIIFPSNMNGKSLLDVGCALGYFCFEAEERGASPIVGIELKEKRFKSANILKKIRGSNVKFIKQDIIQEPIEDKFDYVLCLNIIHHLLEPIKIIRQLAYITKDTLVIEFPTFSDQKYRKHTLLFTPWFYNRMPLIGVSSLTKFDQTFIFSPKSIKKILLNHEPLFKKVKIVQSPIKGRMIAICKK